MLYYDDIYTAVVVNSLGEKSHFSLHVLSKFLYGNSNREGNIEIICIGNTTTVFWPNIGIQQEEVYMPIVIIMSLKCATIKCVCNKC